MTEIFDIFCINTAVRDFSSDTLTRGIDAEGSLFFVTGIYLSVSLTRTEVFFSTSSLARKSRYMYLAIVTNFQTIEPPFSTVDQSRDAPTSGQLYCFDTWENPDMFGVHGGI